MTDITTLPIDELAKLITASEEKISRLFGVADVSGMGPFTAELIYKEYETIDVIRAELKRRVLSGQGQEAV